MDLNRLKIDRREAAPAARATRHAPRAAALPLGKIAALAVVAGAAWLFHAPLLEFVDRFRLPVVETAEVVRRSAATAGALSGAAANGYVVARVKAALSADTPGRIVELNVVEGQRVPKGFVVARLYAAEYEAALASAEADHVAAQATLARERAALETAHAARDRLAASSTAATAESAADDAELRLAKIAFKRMAELVANNVEDQSKLDAAESLLAAKSARVDASRATAEAAVAAAAEGVAQTKAQEAAVAWADAQVGVKKADRDQAAATLDKTIIRAPFDGIVVLKDAEVGEVVSPNVQAGGNARGSVVTMVDFSTLEVQAEVPEASIALVAAGAPAVIYLDAWPGIPHKGKVERIWPTANRQKATIEVRASFTAPDDRLRPEMGCRVVFNAEAPAAGDAAADRLLVPYDAVVRSGGKATVFVVERGVAHERAVELGGRAGDLVVVEDGVNEGDAVVRNPPASLADGGRVRQEGTR